MIVIVRDKKKTRKVDVEGSVITFVPPTPEDIERLTLDCTVPAAKGSSPTFNSSAYTGGLMRLAVKNIEPLGDLDEGEVKFTADDTQCLGITTQNIITNIINDLGSLKKDRVLGGDGVYRLPPPIEAEKKGCGDGGEPA